ncbi:MAG: hypothetical protein ACRDI2_22680, partial [Chloroflexota bacterium]
MDTFSDATGRRTAPRGWLIASLVALAYFFSSLVVVLNSAGNATGVIWLPSFPAWYYAVTGVLYAPFGFYFAALSSLRADPEVTYSTYALVSRAPFLLGPPIIWTITAAKWRRPRRSSSAGRRARSMRGGPITWLLVLAAAGALYALAPPLRAAVNAGVAALDPRDIGRLRDYLLSFGAWAPFVSFLLMVLQS